MGLFLKTGAGRRLRKYRIHINDRILQLGLPGNLARDLPHSNILGDIDLFDSEIYDDDIIKITHLLWDYKWPIWKNTGDNIGFLSFHMHIKKQPVGTPCETLEEIEKYMRDSFEQEFPENNKWGETPPKDYQHIKINGRDFLYFLWPAKDNMDSDRYHYYLPLSNRHFLHFRFEMGFGKHDKTWGKKYYEQALNDMERIRDSVKIIESANHSSALLV